MKIKYLLPILLLISFKAFGQVINKAMEINIDYYLAVKSNLDEEINTNIDYSNPNLYKENQVFLDSLNLILKEVLSEHPLKNKFVDEVSSLETLIPELGYGKLDALQIYRDSSLLSYTNASLLNSHFKTAEINNLSEEELANIFHSLSPDAAVIGITSSKISNYKEINQVYFLVALVSQDPYYKQPKSVFALWNINEHIYILRSDDTLVELDENDSMWAEIMVKKVSLAKKYRIENPNLKPYEYASYEIELEEGFYREYSKCYQTEKNQDIIDRAKQKIMYKIDQLIAAANKL